MSSKLPKIQELYSDKVLVQKQDLFMALMNQEPKKEWIKVHPFIRDYKYLPIERIEYLLKTIFKSYKIEITREGQSFNSVFVVVRVHYLHPITNKWMFHDGIGASQIQTKKGSSPSDLLNINNNAVGMAYPTAKTEAIKNACKNFGKLFGSDISRGEDIVYSADLLLIPFDEEHPNFNKAVTAIKEGKATMEQLKYKYEVDEKTEAKILKLIK